MLKLYTYAVSQLNSLRKDEEGVTAIEYGLIAGAIAVAIIAVLLSMGEEIFNLFTSVETALEDVNAAGGS